MASPVEEDVQISVEEETIRSWNEWATLYNDKFMDLSIYDESYHNFLLQIASFHGNESSISLLDIGCGPGVIARYVLTPANLQKCCLSLSTLSFTGIDAAPKMIELAKTNFPQAQWLSINSRALKDHFNSPQFHSVFLGFCIPYISEKDIHSLITDISSILYAKGLLYISFVEGDQSSSGFKSNAKGERVMFYYYPEEVIAQILSDQDFRIHDKLLVNFHRPGGSADERHIIFIAEKC